jgi:hypothetical protein
MLYLVLRLFIVKEKVTSLRLNKHAVKSYGREEV